MGQSNRVTRVFVRLGHFLLISGTLICAASEGFAQSPEQFQEQTQGSTLDGALPASAAPTGSEQASAQPTICGPAHLGRCLKDIAQDQAGIWTSPLRIQSRDLFWLVPFASATAVAIHYDVKAQQELGIDQSRIDTSDAISQLGATYTVLGEAGALYAVGRLTHNDHLAETGRLGAEAIIDATLVSEALKLATNRERPDEGNGTGGFWPHGTRTHSDSFPSGHAIESWAFAHVIASEYPNKLTQVGVYAFATAISVSRVTSRRHFPSDALVGSVFGYLIGGYVIRHHSAESAGLGFSFVPLVNMSTHTFGASIALRPDQLSLPRIARTVKEFRRTW